MSIVFALSDPRHFQHFQRRLTTAFAIGERPVGPEVFESFGISSTTRINLRKKSEQECSPASSGPLSCSLEEKSNRNAASGDAKERFRVSLRRATVNLCLLQEQPQME